MNIKYSDPSANSVSETCKLLQAGKDTKKVTGLFMSFSYFIGALLLLAAAGLSNCFLYFKVSVVRDSNH